MATSDQKQVNCIGTAPCGIIFRCIKNGGSFPTCDIHQKQVNCVATTAAAGITVRCSKHGGNSPVCGNHWMIQDLYGIKSYHLIEDYKNNFSKMLELPVQGVISDGGWRDGLWYCYKCCMQHHAEIRHHSEFLAANELPCTEWQTKSTDCQTCGKDVSQCLTHFIIEDGNKKHPCSDCCAKVRKEYLQH